MISAAELAQRIRRARAHLLDVVEALGARASAPGAVGPWSAREVLAHSTDWVRLTIGFIEPDHVDALLEFSDVETFNRDAAARVAEEAILPVRNEFARISELIVPLVEPLSDAELHRTGRFEWAPGQTLARAIAENTYAHFDEHSVQLRTWAGLP